MTYGDEVKKKLILNIHSVLSPEVPKNVLGFTNDGPGFNSTFNSINLKLCIDQILICIFQNFKCIFLIKKTINTPSNPMGRFTWQCKGLNSSKDLIIIHYKNISACCICFFLPRPNLFLLLKMIKAWSCLHFKHHCTRSDTNLLIFFFSSGLLLRWKQRVFASIHTIHQTMNIISVMISYVSVLRKEWK